MGALDSTCFANEYSSAAEAFKIDHGKWARTNSNPSLTLKNKVTLFPGVTLSLTGLVASDLICPPGHGSANRPGLA